MILPKSIRIGAHDYQIEELEEVPNQDGEELLGCLLPGALLIIIESGLPNSRKAEVLIHECLHAMLSGTNQENEELMVGVLGEALCSFFKHNPTLVRTLLTALKD